MKKEFRSSNDDKLPNCRFRSWCLIRHPSLARFVIYLASTFGTSPLASCSMLTLLFLGDIVGEPGRSAVITRLPELKERHAIDFVVVNGENAAGGRGITGKITIDLLRAGVSVITTGDHIWDQKDIINFIETEPRLLRPINYPAGAPGGGSIILETAKGKVGVIDVQARTFMQPILENPFDALDAAVAQMREETPIIFVDAHGETTSEKIAIGRFL